MPANRSGPGSHGVWSRASRGRKVTLPHHARDMPESTLRKALREAGITVENFLRV